MMTIYDFKVKDVDGKDVDLSVYKNKLVLIVNIASKCGLTPQLADLELLYRKYKNNDFVILGFPCNQFGNQAPEKDKEMLEFCSMNYEVSFPVFSKIEVNGDNTAPLYKFLKDSKFSLFGSKIKWNFTKFLVAKNGQVYKRYAPITNPRRISKDIDSLL